MGYINLMCMAMAAVSSRHNIANSTDGESISISRITTDMQGATGSIEWVIDHFNHFSHATDEKDTSKRVESPIFVACGHRWVIHLLNPSYCALGDQKDETKGTNVDVHLYLARDESNVVIASTNMTIKGLGGSSDVKCNNTYPARGARGYGLRISQPKLLALTCAPDHQLSIRVDIAVIHQHINGQLSDIITTPIGSQVPALIDAFHQLLTTGTNR